MMISRKVIAKNVKNLTDARYFAAWGVEWICFPLEVVIVDNKIDPRILEITNWLEGCQFALQIDKEEDLNRVPMELLKKSFKGIMLENGSMNTNLNGIKVIGQNADIELVREIDHYKDSSAKGVYIDDDMSLNDLREWAEMYPKLGFVLSGGEEEKVGYKSFEELDRYFELLEE